jgi:hypothetical protein
LISSKFIELIDQLPLDPPVLIGFLLAPEDLVLAFAINFELPPACTLVFALEAVFLSATFLLIANPIFDVLDTKIALIFYLAIYREESGFTF